MGRGWKQLVRPLIWALAGVAGGSIDVMYLYGHNNTAEEEAPCFSEVWFDRIKIVTIHLSIWYEVRKPRT